jgi:hypothetical protein
MVNEFAAVRSGESLLHFLKKPCIVANHAFHGFNHQGLRIAALSVARRVSFACRSGSKRTSMAQD